MNRQSKLLVLKSRKKKKLEQEKLKTESYLQTLIPEVKDGEDGLDGYTPSEQELKSLIEPLIPMVKDGKDGRTPTPQELKRLVKPLVPSSVKGDKGEKGEDGKSFTYRGEWKYGTKYSLNDVVEHAGSSYLCKKAHTSKNDNVPDSGMLWKQYWGLLAKRGQDGSSGTSTVTSGTFEIPQLDADPASPDPEDAWVLHTSEGSGAVAGSPLGLLLSLTDPGGAVTHTYAFKYRTLEGTTKSVTLT